VLTAMTASPAPLSHLRWRDLKAPTIEDMEAIAREEFDRLPEAFRALCGDLVIRVEEFATDEVLDKMRIDDPLDLLGLFEGVGLPFQSTLDSGRMPNMIWLYRLPILDYWAAHDETFGAVVSHVLVHEIGHHFGLSDDDMDAIEKAAE
jgi:predicted Zn-dependent protease with MMP-like domain